MTIIPFPRALPDPANFITQQLPPAAAPISSVGRANRRYANALTANVARRELHAGAGRQFDSELVEALARLLDRGLEF